MNLSTTVLTKRRIVILVWVLAFVAAAPAILGYSHFISYSQTNSAPANSESSKAQAILAKLSPQNSSLTVVVQSQGDQVKTGDSILQFQSELASKTIPYFSSSSSAFSQYAAYLDKINGSGSGLSYVEANGLEGAPSSITSRSVSNDSSTYLVTVSFTVDETFRTANDTYPAQSATPIVRSLASSLFGSSAQVTGQGAEAYDSQSLTSSFGFVFGFTFIFLAIAVAVTLASGVAAVVALLVVGLSVALGYVAIYLTGVLIGPVDFTVTYAQTDVLLGVATDYLVFILWRYREGLRSGLGSREALQTSMRRAGFAVVVSGLTVAGGLGVLSFVPALRSWGPVLLVSIVFAVLLVSTLLPAIVSLIGPRIFLKRALRVEEKTDYRKSRFYKTASFSTRRAYLVAGVILLLAAPAVYFWFNVPTTYNFDEGLPKSLQSVQALDAIDQKFGSNLINPTYVIENFTQNLLLPNGSLTSAGRAALLQSNAVISSTPGVKTVIGPLAAAQSRGPNPFIFNGGLSAYFLVFSSYDPYSAQQLALVNSLRGDSGFLVGGVTSSIIDLQKSNSTTFAQLDVLILVVIAVILGASFRSWKFPLISLSGVFISITWTTGAIYLISKYVLGEQLLYLIPLILYLILKSLGNDFSVFIFTRVKEEQERLGQQEGLARAMVGSGTVVTALGVILAASLGSLGLIPFGFLQELGIAFAISLLLDTFVIRTFYFPSMITILQGKKTETPK